MKNFVLFLTVLLYLPRSICSQQLNLDTVIERSAKEVEDVLPQGAKVAVLNFDSNSETFSVHVIEELTGKLVTGRKITIVDRRNMALISQEMNLQLSGNVSDESAQAIGKLLGAQSIISGSLTNMGNFYRFRIRVINVETAAIQTQISLDLRNDEQVAFLLGGSPTITPPVTTGGTASNITTPVIAGNSISNASIELYNKYFGGINIDKWQNAPVISTQVALNIPSAGNRDLQTAAIVNMVKSESITVRQFRLELARYEKNIQRQLSSDERRHIIDLMVNERLVAQAAEKDRITISEDDVNQQINKLKIQLTQIIGKQPTDAEFSTAVRNETGLEMRAFREQVKRQLIVQKYFTVKKQNFNERAIQETLNELRKGRTFQVFERNLSQ